jgi:hypothetical protein
MKKLTLAMLVLFVSATVLGFTTSSSAYGDEKKKDDKKTEKKEIGSDKRTGGPTQKDRDDMRSIQKGANDLRERKQKEAQQRKEKEKKDKK